MRTFVLLFLCAIQTQASGPVSGIELESGKPITVAPAKNGTVAVFLSAKCPCSHSHLGLLRQLVKDFPSFHFVAIHSNTDEPLKMTKEYFAQAQLGIPVIQDEKSVLADELKALKTPHAYLISPAGEILYKGGITNSATGPAADKQHLRAALEDVVAGHEVRVPASRTLGCVIAR